MSKGMSLRRLNNKQIFALMNYVEANRSMAEKTPAASFATIATRDLGFDISVSSILKAYHDMEVTTKAHRNTSGLHTNRILRSLALDLVLLAKALGEEDILSETTRELAKAIKHDQ